MSQHEAIGKSDEWYTQKYIFDALECRFDLDVAAPFNIEQLAVPADEFIYEGSLFKKWHGFVWCNPPFGGRNGIVPWLDKISQHGNGIALTPDRTSAPWWQDACLKADAHLQIAGKVKFISGAGSNNCQPSNGTTLFAYGNQAIEALINAQNNGLGILFKQLKSA